MRTWLAKLVFWRRPVPVLTIVLTPEIDRRFRSLRVLSESTSISEVLTKALATYEALKDFESRGYEIQVVDNESQTFLVVVIP